MMDEDVIMWTSIKLLSIVLILLLVVFVIKALKPHEPSLQEILLQSRIKSLIRNTRHTDNVIRIRRSESDTERLKWLKQIFGIGAPRSRPPCGPFKTCSLDSYFTDARM
jgi:hypothetical protein